MALRFFTGEHRLISLAYGAYNVQDGQEGTEGVQLTGNKAIDDKTKEFEGMLKEAAADKGSVLTDKDVGKILKEHGQEGQFKIQGLISLSKRKGEEYKKKIEYYYENGAFPASVRKELLDGTFESSGKYASMSLEQRIALFDQNEAKWEKRWKELIKLQVDGKADKAALKELIGRNVRPDEIPALLERDRLKGKKDVSWSEWNAVNQLARYQTQRYKAERQELLTRQRMVLEENRDYMDEQDDMQEWQKYPDQLEMDNDQLRNHVTTLGKTVQSFMKDDIGAYDSMQANLEAGGHPTADASMTRQEFKHLSGAQRKTWLRETHRGIEERKSLHKQLEVKGVEMVRQQAMPLRYAMGSDPEKNWVLWAQQQNWGNDQLKAYVASGFEVAVQTHIGPQVEEFKQKGYTAPNQISWLLNKEHDQRNQVVQNLRSGNASQLDIPPAQTGGIELDPKTKAIIEAQIHDAYIQKFVITLYEQGSEEDIKAFFRLNAQTTREQRKVGASEVQMSGAITAQREVDRITQEVGGSLTQEQLDDVLDKQMDQSGGVHIADSRPIDTEERIEGNVIATNEATETVLVDASEAEAMKGDAGVTILGESASEEVLQEEELVVSSSGAVSDIDDTQQPNLEEDADMEDGTDEPQATEEVEGQPVEETRTEAADDQPVEEIQAEEVDMQELQQPEDQPEYAEQLSLTQPNFDTTAALPRQSDATDTQNVAYQDTELDQDAEEVVLEQGAYEAPSRESQPRYEEVDTVDLRQQGATAPVARPTLYQPGPEEASGTEEDATGTTTNGGGNPFAGSGVVDDREREQIVAINRNEVESDGEYQDMQQVAPDTLRLEDVQQQDTKPRLVQADDTEPISSSEAKDGPLVEFEQQRNEDRQVAAEEPRILSFEETQRERQQQRRAQGSDRMQVLQPTGTDVVSPPPPPRQQQRKEAPATPAATPSANPPTNIQRTQPERRSEEGRQVSAPAPTGANRPNQQRSTPQQTESPTKKEAPQPTRAPTSTPSQPSNQSSEKVLVRRQKSESSRTLKGSDVRQQMQDRQIQRSRSAHNAAASVDRDASQNKKTLQVDATKMTQETLTAMRTAGSDAKATIEYTGARIGQDASREVQEVGQKLGIKEAA